MNKLKMFVLTALTAATLGIGALAGAPSASAMPGYDSCMYYANRAIANYDTATILWAEGNYSLANFYYGKAAAYQEQWHSCVTYN